MNYNEFFKELEKHEIVLSSYQQNQFKKYEEILKEENEKINLTSITKTEEVVDKDNRNRRSSLKPVIMRVF